VNGLTGTQGWAAPEQYRDAHIATVTADVYSAGAILAWMLTGDQPSLGQVSLPAHPRLRAVLKRATNVNPEGRYASLDELLAAVKASTEASSPTLELLVETQAWSGIEAYVSANLERIDRIIRVLPKMSPRDVRYWCEVDQAGLSSCVIEIAEEMTRDYSDLPYGDIDRFLIWGITVLQQLLQDRKYGVAEEVASALFGATARIHQFKPATAIVDWLNKLDRPGQQAMETALHSSDSFEFFSAHANSRWKQRGENDLMVRLRREG
jgi:serine/threonine protein kinase